jgi:putative phage-type endonuclease
MATARKYSRLNYQNEAEWHAIRKQGIGGSDVAAICGVNPYKSPLQVYYEKVDPGKITPFTGNRFTEWGTILEPIVAEKFAQETGLVVRELKATLADKKYPFMRANIDRKIAGKNEGLEIKTTSAWNAGKISEGIPDVYAAQCHHYMMVTGWQRWHLAVLIGGNDFKTFVIERDEEVIQYLKDIEINFWENHVLKKEPPLPSAQDGSLLQDLYPDDPTNEIELDNPDDQELIKRFLTIQEQEKDLKKEKDEIANRLKKTLGDFEAHTALVGNSKVTWKPFSSTRFDSTRFKSEFPKVWAKYSNTTRSRRFTVSPIKK